MGNQAPSPPRWPDASGGTAVNYLSRRWLAIPALALLLAVGLALPARASHDAPTNVGFRVAHYSVPFTYSAYQIYWTAPADNAQDSYKIQWKSGTQDWDETNRQKTAQKAHTAVDFLFFVNELTEDTEYTFRVGAVVTSGGGHDTWSAEITHTPRHCATGDTAILGATMPAGSNHDYTLLSHDCTYLLNQIQDVLDPAGELNWSDDLALTSWHGVDLHRGASYTSTEPVRVVDLELFGGVCAARTCQTNETPVKLTGVVPVAFGGNTGNDGAKAPLGELAILDLSDNQLTGGIPPELGGDGSGNHRMDNLAYLMLADNPLGGTIPPELGNLDNLTILWLYRAQLTGTIPAGLDTSDPSDPKPTGLAKLSSIFVRLWLSGNQFTGEIPPDLGRVHLYALDLSDNQLTGEIPEEFFSLPKNNTGGYGEHILAYLDLSGNRLTGEIPAGTDNTDPSDPKPTGLAKLKEIIALYLHDNQLSGEIPVELAQIATDTWTDGWGSDGIEVLLNCNKLSGTAPDELGDIDSTDSNAYGPIDLTKLGLSHNPNLTISAALQAKAGTQLAAGAAAVTCTAPAPPPTAPVVSAPAPAPAPKPRLAVTLRASPDPVTVGQTISYTLTVTNTGEVPLTGVFWRSSELGVAHRAIGDGTLAVDAAAEASFGFGPVTAQHLPGPVIVNVFADSDQTDAVGAALGVAVQAAPAPAPTATATATATATGTATATATGTATSTTTPTPTPSPGPRPAESTLDLTIARAGYSAPDPPEPHLGHNILDLQLTAADGTTVACDFLTHYETTGGLTRWGYATSEILEERLGALTQYYQRGTVDCHFRDGRWRMERRLTWDFIGGGVLGAPDLGVEPDLLSDQPGVLVGPWGHCVSNYAVDGTFNGFLDFFRALGGVRTFGYPKTEARSDDHPDAVLRLPGATPGFIRQYFQAAVFEYHPDDPDAPVKLGLAGDLLRDLLYPDEAYLAFRSFQPAPPLDPGQPYEAERVIWGEDG